MSSAARLEGPPASAAAVAAGAAGLLPPPLAEDAIFAAASEAATAAAVGSCEGEKERERASERKRERKEVRPSSKGLRNDEERTEGRKAERKKENHTLPSAAAARAACTLGSAAYCAADSAGMPEACAASPASFLAAARLAASLELAGGFGISFGSTASATEGRAGRESEGTAAKAGSLRVRLGAVPGAGAALEAASAGAGSCDAVFGVVVAAAEEKTGAAAAAAVVVAAAGAASTAAATEAVEVEEGMASSNAFSGATKPSLEGTVPAGGSLLSDSAAEAEEVVEGEEEAFAGSAADAVVALAAASFCWLFGEDIDARAPAGSLATAAALADISGAGAGATGMIPGTSWLAIAVPTAVTKGLGCGGTRCGRRCLRSEVSSAAPASSFPEEEAAAFAALPPVYAATCSGVTFPESRAAWSLAASCGDRPGGMTEEEAAALAAAGAAPGAAAAAFGFGGSGASKTSWRVVGGGGGGVESIERRCWCLVSREAAAAAVERQALSEWSFFLSR